MNINCVGRADSTNQGGDKPTPVPYTASQTALHTEYGRGLVPALVHMSFANSNSCAIGAPAPMKILAPPLFSGESLRIMLCAVWWHGAWSWLFSRAFDL